MATPREILIPCPMSGCTGSVQAFVARGVNSGAVVAHSDDVPLVVWQAGCSSPFELEGPVNEALGSPS